MFRNNPDTCHVVTDTDGSVRFVVLNREALEDRMKAYARTFYKDGKIGMFSAEQFVILRVEGRARYFAGSLPIYKSDVPDPKVTTRVYIVYDRDSSPRFVVLHEDDLKDKMMDYARVFSPDGCFEVMEETDDIVVLQVDGRERYFAYDMACPA
jgi:hypothetical protein